MYVIFVLDFSNAQNCEKNGYPKKCLFGKICFSSRNIGERISKGGFFSESEIRFSSLQISRQKLLQITILNMKFEIPAVNNSFKFQAQDNDME